ncbi:MAG: L,D-transpeptidase family protein [Candidatus Omnitrophota bacterium]
MIRAMLLCFILLLPGSTALARLVDEDAAQKLLLDDFFAIKNTRYLEGAAYYHFSQGKIKLHLASVIERDPLAIVYKPERMRRYKVQPEDTLYKIARRNGTTMEFIKELNRIKGDGVKLGQLLWIPDQTFTLEINKTLNCLYFKTGDVVIKEYPVSTGKSANQTPVGTFFIQSRYPYPTWFHKGVVVSPVSPDNYLGSRWLGFNKPQFGIHGTIFPELIGRPVSKGCIRMKNEDVEELYDYIPVGTIVTITEI